MQHLLIQGAGRRSCWPLEDAFSLFVAVQEGKAAFAEMDANLHFRLLQFIIQNCLEIIRFLPSFCSLCLCFTLQASNIKPVPLEKEKTI